MKKFDITSELQCEKTLEINYITGYGKGKMILNLDEILPCSAHDFKIIMQTIEKVTCPDRNGIGMYDIVDKLNAYIIAVIDTCKSLRDKLDKDVDKRWIAEINGIMKKYISLNGMLADEFDIEKVSDTDAEIKLKKATVYGLVFDNEGKMEAQEFSGWIFTKNGVVFDVYNSGKKGKPFYEILLHGTGTRVAWSQKRREIPLAINDNVMKFIVENPDKIADIKKEYNAAMLEAGFIEPEIQAAETTTEQVENVVEITKAETPAENVAETTNEHNNTDIAAIRRVYYITFPLASDRHTADTIPAYHGAPMIHKASLSSTRYGYAARIMPYNIMSVSIRYPVSAAFTWIHRQDKGHCIRGSPTNIFSVYTTQSR